MELGPTHYVRGTEFPDKFSIRISHLTGNDLLLYDVKGGRGGNGWYGLVNDANGQTVRLLELELTASEIKSAEQLRALQIELHKYMESHRI